MANIMLKFKVAEDTLRTPCTRYERYRESTVIVVYRRKYTNGPTT